MVGIEAFISHSPLGDDDQVVAPVMYDSEFQLGVSYQGPWSAEADGFNEHVRRSSRALHEAGCPVHLRSPGPQVFYGAPKDLPPKLKPMLTASISRYSALIHQTILSATSIHTLVMHHRLTPEELATVNRYKVIYTVFEKDSVHPDTVRALNLVGQVWVACQKNADMLVHAGVERDKVRVIPIPFFSDDPLLALRDRPTKKGPVRFYHIGKWEPRKAQDRIIEAFLRAFVPGEAQLVLRCSELRAPIDGYPRGPREALRAMLEKPKVKANGWTSDNVKRAVEVVSEKLTDEGILKLHGFGEVYVTLSRGEGFDMPCFDAKLAGNIVVYTPSGGPQDFTDQRDVLVPASGSIACHPFYGWEQEATYLDFDLKQAIDGLREARSRARQLSMFNEQKTLGKLEAFTSERVGAEMLSSLQDLVGPEGKVYKK